MTPALLTHTDADLLAPQDWSFPVPIAYGPDRMSEIAQHCQRLGITNPLIVTDQGSRDLPFLQTLQNHLSGAKIPCALFTDISPNPRDDEISAGRAAYRSGGHDSIIAIGGGSAMDGGKAICLVAQNDIDLWAFEYEQTPPKITAPFPKLITIPTTAGTGAETESTAMVTDTQKGMKFCIWHSELKPSLALLDPSLTLALPAKLTAWTGVDAMVHAIEAYLVPDFNPLCDGLALEALSLTAQCLPLVADQPSNLAARGGMLAGSCLAGISFMKGLGLVHAISHMVGAEYDTQHGLTNAIILPVVLRYNLPGQEVKTARMCQAMGLSDSNSTALISHIEQLLNSLEIPKSLGEIGVPLESAPRLAAKALKDSAAGTNPRAASLEDMQKLIETAISGAR